MLRAQKDAISDAIGPADSQALALVAWCAGGAAKIEACRSIVESAHKIKQLYGQVSRLTLEIGLSGCDVTVGLRGALSVAPKSHYTQSLNRSGQAN